MYRSSLAIATAGLALAGCVTVAPPAPAVLAFERQDCDARPDLASAVSLTPEKETALHHVSRPIGGASPCLTTAGGPVGYVLFAIPGDYEDKTLTVGGLLEPLRILSPRVSVLDASGETSRSFPADEFLYRGLNYSVLMRPRPGERYVLITADGTRVGQRYDSIAISTTTSSTYTPYGAVSFTTGNDAGVSRTFSYEGTAQIAVNDSDTKEEGLSGTR